MDTSKYPTSDKEAHGDQTRLVAASLLHAPGHDVYRRRLMGGAAASVVRDAVRAAVREALKHPGCTHENASEAGALAADRALSQVGIEIDRVGCDRQGWRARLAHLELYLAMHVDAMGAAISGEIEVFDFVTALGGATAVLNEVRAMIDLHEAQR